MPAKPCNRYGLRDAGRTWRPDQLWYVNEATQLLVLGLNATILKLVASMKDKGLQ